MPCPPLVPISIIPPVSEGVAPILWRNGNQITRLNIPLNPSFLVYDGTKTRWGDGSAQAPVYLPNIQEVNGPTLTYVAGITSTGQLVKTLGASGTALIGGVAGSVPYQSAPSTTGFTAAGTTGQLLSSNGASAPTWLNQSAITAGSAASATTATNIASGVAGSIPYQSAPSTTGFTAAGTSGQVLLSNGTSAPTWSTNIAGQAGSVADGSVTPAKLSTGGPYWDTTGNVGIGTSSPSASLDVRTNSTSGQINLGPTGGATGIILATNAGMQLGSINAQPLYLQTNNVVRASIAADGTINAGGNPITNCPTTAKAWAYVTGLVNTNGAAQTFTGNNVASIVRGATAGLYTITLTSGTFAGPVVISPISATNNAGARVNSYSGNTCVVQMYVGATATDTAFNIVYFSN